MTSTSTINSARGSVADTIRPRCGSRRSGREGPHRRGADVFLQGGAVVARLAHNQKVVGSNPTSATSLAPTRSLAENGMVATPRDGRWRTGA